MLDNENLNEEELQDGDLVPNEEAAAESPVVIAYDNDDEDQVVAEEEEEEEEEEGDLDEILAEEDMVTGSGHDDYDWSISDKGNIVYSEQDRANFMDQYDATLNSLIENEIVRGRVTSINSGDVVLDINYKSDGLVSLSEFRDFQNLAGRSLC